MTELQLRNKAVSQARAWLGCNESDGSHRKIVDVYNSHSPLARGYRLKYTDPWCAGFVSAVAIACGITDIMPTEVSCPQMIGGYQKLGRWQESDSYLPKPGDLVMYDWYDTGSGDCTGQPEHVGMVEAVSGGTVTVIEGNYANAVKRRGIPVNGRYIRGYCLPDYASKATGEEEGQVHTLLPELSYGMVGECVRAMQILLTGRGVSCGRWGTDGEFGPDTLAAVKAFQTNSGLDPDGICGNLTWSALLCL